MSQFQTTLRRALGSCALAVLLAATASAAPQAEGSFDRTLNVRGTPDITVQTGAGNVTVVPGSDAIVRIQATLRSRRGDAADRIRRIEQNPPIEQNGSTIVIGRFTDRDLTRNVSISYELTVPSSARVKGTSGSGNVHIENVRGPVTAMTGSGNVELIRTGGEIRASTGSGAIDIDSTGGSVQASTGSGTIRVAGVAGTLDVSTGSGNIRGAGSQRGDWALSTGSGNITVDLPDDGAFTLDAHTGSGSIDSDQPITASGRFRRDTLRGDVRGGGPLLKVRTGSGSISIQ